MHPPQRHRRTPGWWGGGRFRTLTVLVALPAMLLTLAVPASAQSLGTSPDGPLAPYVVLMAQDPVIAAEVDLSTDAAPVDVATPRARAQASRLEREHTRTLQRAGVSADAKRASFTYAVNGFSAALTTAQAQLVARQPGVAKVVRDELKQLQTDTSPGFLGIDHRRGAWAAGYTGEGVVIGVIDTGIWPEHPSFADDGSYAAPPPGWMGGEIACEFGDTAHNPDDAPFDCNNKLIGARDMRTLYKEFVGPEVYNSTRDYNGHGTHTAGTAGGNRDVAAEVLGVARGTVSGIAPRAHVAAYSACGDEGCFGGDLAAAIGTAIADGVDVINYSIGGGPGLTGPDDIAFLFANAAGVFSATSAGNAGPGAGTVGSPANDPWVVGVAASTHDRTFEGTVTLGNGASFTGASLTGGAGPAPLVDAADHGNELCDPTVQFSPPIEGAIVACLRAEIARVAKSQAVFEQGGAGMVLYNAADSEAEVTDNHYLPTVHISASDGQQVLAYIDAAGQDAEATLGAGEPAPAQGSAMADFSSRGPNAAAASLIKPDVTAPGVNVLAGNTPTPTLGPPGELYQAISGTSMASPHVAGVLALLKQAHPDWSPAMAQSAVVTTARHDVVKEDGQTVADPFDMGGGHLVVGDPARRNSVFEPGLVYHAGFNDYLGFMCEAGPEVFADPAATCAALAAAGVPTTVEGLNYPSIGAAAVAGDVTVQRTVTNVTDRRINWRAFLDGPAGYDVTVSPRMLRLGAGESATVEIRIVNRSAPAGEWRFGSMHWKGAGYKVESPIAVRASELSAPEVVSGTGTAGELSFDLRFGYSGDYQAAAHGLASQVGVAGSVDQDPDQTFDPNDPAGTTAHEFAISGSSHLRVAVDTADLAPPDAAIDLDLFLFNDQGQQVATSTSGGTDEQIDLSLPADGTYTLFVHGWQTTGITVDYVLRTWEVPGTSGGSLEIISAPDAAVIGGTGTIEAGWSGLDPDARYLGAVSHTGPAGPLGLTLVEVTG